MAADPPEDTDYVSIPHGHATTTLPEWMAGSQIRILVRMRPPNTSNGKDRMIQSFSTIGGVVQAPNNLVDADTVVDIWARSMNVVLKNIYDGPGIVALSKGQSTPGGSVALSKKERFTLTPRETNEDYFRLEYDSYHRSGSNQLRK